MNPAFLAPELMVVAVAFVAFTAALFKESERPWLGYAVAAGFAGALATDIIIMAAGVTETAFGGSYHIDMLSAAFKAILLLTTAIVALASAKDEATSGGSDFYILVSFASLGAMLMASAGDLLVLFVALELTVMPSYALAALKGDGRASEAAVKYFLLGMIASAVFLYGASLVFGLTGSIAYSGIASALAQAQVSPALVVGIVALVAGLGFKVAAVPFHFWAPDVYEGASVPVASYMAVGPKTGGFAALIRLFATGLGMAVTTWAPLFAIVAVASMLVGNLSALSQTHLRRLLAYSGIAHTGYLLVGLSVTGDYARTSIAFYLLVYSLAALGAFLVILAASTSIGERVEDFAGLGKRSPALAFAMAIFLFSLTGIPPLAGFIGKFYIFSSAIRGGMVWLAVFGVVNSVISFGYYSGVIRQMYLVNPVADGEVPVAGSLKTAIYGLALAVVVVGLYPSAILSLLKL